jgi:hypothetical protein
VTGGFREKKNILPRLLVLERIDSETPTHAPTWTPDSLTLDIMFVDIIHQEQK